MIAVLRTPARRISLAIALSALIHAAMLWLPQLRLPRAKAQLPPLSVRIEPLPKPVEQVAAEAVPASLIARPGNGPSPISAVEAAHTMKKMEKSAESQVQTFPRHLQLAFDVYRGTGIVRSGEIHQQLDISHDSYTLRSLEQAAGLSGMQIIQSSHGKVGEQGLQPETYEEEKITAGARQSQKAVFDWTAQKLFFTGGGEVALPDAAQDSLSFMYQLSQLSMNREIIPLSIGDGVHLGSYQIEIGAQEDVATPMGNLRAWHLREMHDQNDGYFEIWLGLEYRLLPVKFRQVDSSGATIRELVISDIRAADK